MIADLLAWLDHADMPIVICIALIGVGLSSALLLGIDYVCHVVRSRGDR